MSDLQPFGATGQGQTVASDGDLDEFVADLNEFYKYGWSHTCRSAARFIGSGAQLPALSDEEAERHMALAGAGVIHSILAEVRKLQAAARRCFSPEAIAHAEHRLSQTASKERSAPAGNSPEDFAWALQDFGKFYGRVGESVAGQAIKFMELTTKLPTAPGGDAEKHFAIAAGTIFQAVLEELAELQETHRQCFTPKDTAQAKPALTKFPYDGPPATKRS